MFGAIAGGIASALAGGAMSKLFGGGQKAASGGIQGDVLATDNNTVGMGDAGIKSLFLLVLILLLMPTLNFLPVWFALSLLRFRLPSRLPMMFILWMVAMMVVIIPSRTV